MTTCVNCGDIYPDFDVAHDCSKGKYAPKYIQGADELRKQVNAYESVTADMRKQLDEQTITLVNCANRNKRYRAVMEQAVEALEGKYMRARTLQTINALREVLKDE